MEQHEKKRVIDWDKIKTFFLLGESLRSISLKEGIPSGTILARSSREKWASDKKSKRRICHEHRVPYRECPDDCGYKYMFSLNVRKALNKRASLSKSRRAKRNRKKQEAVLESKNTQRLCKCGSPLGKWRHFCDSCRDAIIRERCKRPKKRPNRYCKKCGNQLPKGAKRYCSASCFKQRPPRALLHKTCPVCLSVFATINAKKIFCSDNCSWKSRHPIRQFAKEAKCELCHAPFMQVRATKRFCSDKCCDRQHHILELRRRREVRAAKNAQQPPKTCRICSQTFSTNHPNHVLCSKKCRNKAARIKMRIRDKGKKKLPHVMVKGRLSSRLRELLRRKGQQKKNSISAYMGCTPKEMVAHVERQFTKGMSWENYGVFGWHLDHIIPCQRFDLTKEDHCRVCFNWRNIRPLWGEHNWNRQEMLTLDEALQIDPVLVEMAKEVGVRLW